MVTYTLRNADGSLWGTTASPNAAEAIYTARRLAAIFNLSIFRTVFGAEVPA